jgi:hypothetical protein
MQRKKHMSNLYSYGAYVTDLKSIVKLSNFNRFRGFLLRSLEIRIEKRL